MSDYDRIIDETPWAGDMDGDIGGYRSGDIEEYPSHEDDTGDVTHDFSIRAYLDYESPEAAELAVDAEMLGIHTGNVALVWGDTQAIVPLHFYSNSPCVHDDASGKWSWASMRPIPLDMAERIHPRAFDTLYYDVLEMLRHQNIAPDLLDHITSRPRFKKLATYQAWLDAKRDGLPGLAGPEPEYFSAEPTLGNGDPITHATQADIESMIEEVTN